MSLLAGFRVVDENLSNAEWKEAFIHPKSANGVLVQLAEALGISADAVLAPPPLRAPRPARAAGDPARHDPQRRHREDRLTTLQRRRIVPFCGEPFALPPSPLVSSPHS